MLPAHLQSLLNTHNLTVVRDDAHTHEVKQSQTPLKRCSAQTKPSVHRRSSRKCSQATRVAPKRKLCRWDSIPARRIAAKDAAPVLIHRRESPEASLPTSPQTSRGTAHVQSSPCRIPIRTFDEKKKSISTINALIQNMDSMSTCSSKKNPKIDVRNPSRRA